MTTITIKTNGLEKAVAIASTFMASEGDFQGKIVIGGEKGKIIIKSTDMVQSIILKDLNFTSTDLTNDNFAPFSIDGKKLLTVLKSTKAEEIHIELHQNFIFIKSGRSKVKIEILAQTQVVEIPTGEESFDFSEQIKDIEKVLHSVDIDNPKYELNGVLLQVKNGAFSVVGTDTKRLASVTTKTSLSDNSLIVPKKGIENILKLFGGLNLNAKIDETTLSIRSESMDYSTKLIGGKYPQWESIVPSDTKQKVSMSRKGLEAIVKEASIFEAEIIIRISDGEILVTDVRGNTEVTDTFQDETANILFSMNSKIILDFLASYSDDMVQIGFNSSNTPILLIANSNYKEVAMPLMMEEEDIQEAA